MVAGITKLNAGLELCLLTFQASTLRVQVTLMVLPTMMLKSKTETEKGVKDSDFQGVSSTLGNERGRGGGAEESRQ
jgi:hypothetical protein